MVLDPTLNGANMRFFIGFVFAHFLSIWHEEHIGRRMSIQKMLRKRIPLHPSWNYIIFA